MYSCKELILLSSKKEEKMSWISDKTEKFRQVPNPYFSLHVTAKFLGGVGIGLLLAYWLPLWSWWLFIVAGVLIAIPSARIILRK